MSRGRGRPSQHIAIPVFTWVMVELMRDREPPRRGRHSVRAACVNLSTKLAKYGDFPPPTLRRLHGEAQTKMKHGIGPEQLEQHHEKLLREVRERRATCGWGTDPLQFLGLD